MSKNPQLFEIHAALFLKRLFHKYRRSLKLLEIPEKEWIFFRERGFDFIWLMGIWKRSPGARQCALTDPALLKHYSEILPGWTEDDISGSPYAVYGYEIDPGFGSPEDLLALKPRLNSLGLKLILDFIPNHLALDHPWVKLFPERFIQADQKTAEKHPDLFYQAAPGIFFAHGKDPYFPAWSDTVQNNFFSLEMRESLISELLKIAACADGLRCDMAMLAMNQIFKNVWGEFIPSGGSPEREFWAEAISAVKKKYPEFLFMAEVYWNLEWDLQQLGFDYTYDKTFYDRLRYSNALDIRGHLMAEPSYQDRSVRFLENHDEKRALCAFGKNKSMAAAVVISTVRGLRFFHDGQAEARLRHQPIQLTREPDHVEDKELKSFYESLWKVTSKAVFHKGDWKLLEAGAVDGKNRSPESFLAWIWQYQKEYRLVVVNYANTAAEGLIRGPGSGNDFPKEWKEIFGTGVWASSLNQLQVRLDPWGFLILGGVGSASAGRLESL